MSIETFNLTWQDIDFTLTIEPEYFTDMAHVEIRCERPLPITGTGYKSLFIPQDELPDTQILCAEILQQMTDTARETGWTRHDQLNLFDC